MSLCYKFLFIYTYLRQRKVGNALARVQRVDKPVDLWDIALCTRRFWGSKYFWHLRILRPIALFYRTDCTPRYKFLMHALSLKLSIKLSKIFNLLHPITSFSLTEESLWSCYIKLSRIFNLLHLSIYDNQPSFAHNSLCK